MRKSRVLHRLKSGSVVTAACVGRVAEPWLAEMVGGLEAVERVPEIAAVDGVDGLFLGLGDLSIAHGVPFNTSHPLVTSARDKVAAAGDRGARLITGGSDHVALMTGFQNSLEDLRKVKAPENATSSLA